MHRIATHTLGPMKLPNLNRDGCRVMMRWNDQDKRRRLNLGAALEVTVVPEVREVGSPESIGRCMCLTLDEVIWF